MADRAALDGESANTLDGTAGPDFICGYGGNDTIKDLGGNDTLAGGDGNDTMDGGDGLDGTDKCVQGAGTGPRSTCETS